jgi:PAS domain S-box-containing protein
VEPAALLHILAVAVEQAAEAVMVTTVEGTIVYVNAAFERLTGYTAAEAIGNTPNILRSGKQDQAFYRRYWETLLSGMVWHGEITNRRKDGSLYREEHSASPIRDAEGRLTHFISIGHDVSERARIRQELDLLETVTVAISTVPNFESALATALRLICETTGWDYGEAWIPSTGLTLLTCSPIGYAVDPRLESFRAVSEGMSFMLGRGMPGRIWSSKSPEWHADVSALAPDIYHRSAQAIEAGLKAGFGVPILAGDEVVAVLIFFSTEFREEDPQLVEVVSAVARQLGTLVLQKRAQDEVTRLASIVESSIDAVLGLDLNMNVISWNAGAERLYGYTASEMVGKPTDAIVPPELIAERNRFWEEGRRGAVSAIETVRITKDGRRLQVSVSLFPIVDRDGRVISMGSIARDITDRKREEEARRLAEEQLRTVAENAPVILFATDRDGVCTLAEGRGLASIGMDPRQIVGRSALGVSILRIGESVRRALAGETFNDLVEYSGLSFECRYTPLHDEAGSVSGVIAVATDITERKKAEEALQQAQKLESLGLLAGGIAHDFNNLLVGILGNAGLALAELAPESPARGSVEEIENTARRAADLVRQMLAYSGKGRFIIRRLNLNTLIEEMTHLLQISIGKSAVLKYNFASSLPAVEADATQLRQIIMNLVINASEAIGERSGVITVSTGMMRADRAYLTETYLSPDLAEGDYVYLEVSDTGAGMDQATRERIFDPFFTTKFTGRGLGLAAVLGIVRGHNGAIKVYSEPGRGTTFKALFPCVDAPIDVESAAAPPAVAWKAEGTVLIIDDEETVRAVTARAVERMGFTTLIAADGREGVALFQANAGQVVCVLLDMTMPHLNGEETFGEIRRIDPDARVILMSGYNEQDATNSFAGKGLAGFLQKPYQLATLREALREAIRREPRA